MKTKITELPSDSDTVEAIIVGSYCREYRQVSNAFHMMVTEPTVLVLQIDNWIQLP